MKHHSKQSGNKKYQHSRENWPIDLMDLWGGSTRSMETEDGVKTVIVHGESSRSSAVTAEKDIEAPEYSESNIIISECSEETSESSGHKRIRIRSVPTEASTFSPRSICNDPGSPKQQHSTSKKVTFLQETETRESHQHRKSRRRERKKLVDVHVCTSTMCEACRCNSEQIYPQQEVRFVAAQPLEPKMIKKLKNAPRDARWYEMGESFHDLYQKANSI
jgi:hypothetical protein